MVRSLADRTFQLSAVLSLDARVLEVQPPLAAARGPDRQPPRELGAGRGTYVKIKSNCKWLVLGCIEAKFCK